MWVTVLKAFIDKETGKRHAPGEKLNVKKERAKELLAAGGYVKEGKEEDDSK